MYKKREWLLNCYIAQYYSIICIFAQINAALVSIIESFKIINKIYSVVLCSYIYFFNDIG